MGEQLLNLEDYARRAEGSLPAPHHEYFRGGAADELTLRDNRAAFDRLRLLPHVLAGIERVSLASTLSGSDCGAPILIAPTALNRMAHADAELGVARAAKRHRVVQVLSTLTNTPIEDVVAAGHETWFQLYLSPDRAHSWALVERAEAAGARALLLTVDLPVPGLRENLTRAGYSAPDWARPVLLADLVGDLDDAAFGEYVAAHVAADIGWPDLDELIRRTSLPVWIKGVLRADDAARALDHGVAGLIVSNHGGRQLDTTIASIEALESVVQTVAGQVPVLVDSGIRRGTDVLKALALGADAVLLGRPVLWGLTVNGEAGVDHVLELLCAELRNALHLCGCADPTAVDRSLVLPGETRA